MIFGFFRKKRKTSEEDKIPPEMKYLITGLGNIGSDYAHTRHNIGFDIVDAFAKEVSITFEDARYGAFAKYKHGGKLYILLKPSTYMNLSGKAVDYWLKRENVNIKNLLVLVDDLALPFGKLKLKPKGNDAGHKGLKSIQETLGHINYARLRFGIGDNFNAGRQLDHVLGKWTKAEAAEIPEKIDKAIEIVKSFVTAGLDRTMILCNTKPS
jgi:PTH1 family peptidyl-tRNA hydrolase